MPNEEDTALLDYLEELEMDETDNSWKVTFKFRPNPWLKNCVLWKEYSFGTGEEGKLEASPVEYKEGKKLDEGFFALFFTKPEPGESLE